uniref:Uncharacterized protein n=1 Tax=Ditylenchus dipsaci TaxID=166011 RepID=A0A915D403_9BILA
MGLRKLGGSVKKVFCGPKNKKRWEEEQNKINQELQDALYDQSKILQSFKVTLEDSVSTRRDKEIDQLQNFKRTDEVMNNLKLDIEDERNKNTDLRNDINENDKKIAQLQESVAKNVSHLVAQENTMREGKETVNDLRNEFKDAQTNIIELKQSACNMLLRLSSTEKEVKHLKLLEKDCSDLTLEVQDLVKYKPHLPCPDSLMTYFSKCFFTPGNFDLKLNLKDVTDRLGFPIASNCTTEKYVMALTS